MKSVSSWLAVGQFAMAGIVTFSLSLSMVSAQEISKEHMSAARAALNAAGSTKTLDGILPRLSRRMKGQLILSEPNKEAIIVDVVDQAAIEIAPRRGDLEKEIARIYAIIFTKEELEQIASFYSSVSGKKLLKESPIILRQVNAASKTWTAGVDRDLRGLVADKMNKMNQENAPASE